MIKAMKKKLKSNRGASIMLALALFLICVMVSSVILFATASGNSRNAKREAQQKGYLAVSSAANLIVEELKLSDNQYVGQVVNKKYGCENCLIPVEMVFNGVVRSGMRLDAEYLNNPLDEGHLMIPIIHDDREGMRETVVGNPAVDEAGAKTELKGAFAEMLKRAAEDIYKNQKTSHTEEIRFQLQDTSEPLPEAICKFTMDENYNVSFQVTTENSNYAILIGARADVNITHLEEPGDDKHTVYYKKFIADVGAADMITGSFIDVEDTEWSIPVEVQTTKTIVKWKDIEIEKGVLAD